MSTNYLFPNRYKKIGWMLLIPASIAGLTTLFLDYSPSYLDFRVPALFIDELITKNHIFGLTNNNILNEILGVLTILGFLFVAFSKELIEDEFIAKIRLESLVWATYVNYSILIISFITIYDFSFFWVMVFNMFTTLIFFITHFNWQLSKLKTVTE